MSLDTQIQNLATRTGTEIKSLRTLINGNLADLATLDTTAKGNLVLAINEIFGLLGGAGSGDLLSSNNLSDLGNLGTARANLNVFSQAEVTAAITAAVGGVTIASLNGRTAAEITAEITTAINGVTLSGLGGLTQAEIDARAQLVLDNNIGAAPGTLNTIQELADALNDNPDIINNILAAQANRVRFDAAQTLTPIQQSQVHANIQVFSIADIGAVDTDYVGIFNTALI